MFPKIFFSTLYIILASICIYIIYIVDQFLSMCLLDDVVQPSDEPDLEQPSDEPDLAQPSDEPDLATSSRSIVEPNLQSARTRNLGVQTDGRTEVEDLRSQLEELRRELAAERKASDELRLQLSKLK